MYRTTYRTTYEAGIPTSSMNTIFAAQQMDYWCWSACITMILKAYGISNISQTQFAKSVCGIDEWGRACDCAATNLEISRSLNLAGYDQFGKHFNVKAPLLTSAVNVGRLLSELQNKRPVLVAYHVPNSLMGHAVIITGCEYFHENGQTYVSKLILRDPSPNIINQIAKGRKEVIDVKGFLRSVYSHWYISLSKDSYHQVA